jgi:sortase A
MRKAGYILMFIGVCILIYVGFTQYLVYREQNALMGTVNKINDENIPGKRPNTIESPNQDLPNLTAIGVLEIPSIDLSVAVVEGTTNKDLRYAVGHVEGTGELGKKDNNFAIAGHRAHPQAMFFKKLDKVKENDMFYITTNEKKYTYKVYKIVTVLPEQVEVLEPQKGKSVVTLITCTPIYKSTHRLIVYGELQES